MPSSSRESRSNEANGTGVTSQAVGSSAPRPWESDARPACVLGRRGLPGRCGGRRGPEARRLGERVLVVFEFKLLWLAGAERNDAPDRIVRRDADGDAIPGNHLDTEAAHSAAELSQHFVAGIALHAVETSAVHRDDGALHVDQIVLAQI